MGKTYSLHVDTCTVYLLPVYCWTTFGYQQYKSIHCCCVNAAVGSLCAVVELKIFLTAVNDVNIIVFKQSALYFCRVLAKLGSEHIYVKFPSIKFHKNSSCVNRADIRGQAGIGTDM